MKVIRINADISKNTMSVKTINRDMVEKDNSDLSSLLA